jgi:hypothetical protein
MEAPVAELREYLASRIPAFMVPSDIALLEKLPLTVNGKVDRGALPGRDTFFTTELTIPAAPRNETETALAEIWRDILGRDRVGIYDNFFRLGGHSLLVLQVLSRVARTLRVELPVQAFFETPTIEGMARAMAAAERQPVEWTAIAPDTIQPSRAQRILERLDELSDHEVEELLLELEEEEVK